MPTLAYWSLKSVLFSRWLMKTILFLLRGALPEISLGEADLREMVCETGIFNKRIFWKGALVHQAI